MEDKHKQKAFTALLLAPLALIGTVILLIVIAVLEETVIGSHYVTKLYRQIGIFEPLDWLVDNTVGRYF
jgi:hypothetical protein